MPNDDSTTERNEQPHELLETLSHDDLIKRLTEAEQQKDDYWGRILRMQAEADNLAKRTETEVANAHKYALKRFTNELLPIIDSLELCVSKSTVQNDPQQALQAVIDGVQLTLKMFLTALAKFGIEQVNPVSEPFNPDLHQAIAMQADNTVAPNTVIAVSQKGYTLNQRLVRPALVVVSKAVE